MTFDLNPSGLSSQQTAVRLRDVIRNLSKNTTNSIISKPLVGRVISVDLPRMRGTVWFPGDDQPVEVSIFSNAVPASWQYKVENAGIEGDSISGAGATVVCERLNGILYITNVLTGGMSALDMKTLNMSLLMQEGADIVAGGPSANAAVDIAGKPFETFFNCHVSNTALLDGEAIEFGPFTTYDPGTPGPGAVEMTVTIEGCTRRYQFVTNPKDEYDHPSLANTARPSGWFKVIPCQVATYHEGGGTPFTDFTVFELDITFRKTSYGNTDAFATFKEIWFRLVRVKSINSTGLDAKISIRATNFQKARSLGGRELFMQERNISPEICTGTLGFDNSSNIFGQYSTVYLKDTFGRVTPAGGWGNLDWFSGWTINLNTATDYYTDGQYGVIAVAANNSQYEIGPASAIAVQVFDVTLSAVASAVTTGAQAQVGVVDVVGTPTTGDKYLLGIDLKTDGTIAMSFRKKISGTVSLIGSSTASGLSYSANTKINMRFQLEAGLPTDYLRGKVWLAGTDEPEAWLKDITDTSIGIMTGVFCLYTIAETGNTNTKPYLVKFDKFNFRNGRYSGQTDHPETWHNGPWRSGILRAANDLQKTWTHDGVFTWDGTKLKWTGNIYLSGIGRNYDILTYGKARVAFLPEESSGLLFKVPMDPANADPFFNFITVVVANGIPLAANQSLWCGVPPGTGWDNLFPYLFVVDSSVQIDYELPEWAVLIASRGPSGVSPEIRLGNGTFLDSWKALPFATNWSNFGGSFSTGQYRKEPGNVVRLKGIIKHTATTTTGTFATLPAGFRPTETQLLNIVSTAAGSTGNTRVDINTDGTLVAVAHWSGGGSLFMALDNCTFVVV